MKKYLFTVLVISLAVIGNCIESSEQLEQNPEYFSFASIFSLNPTVASKYFEVQSQSVQEKQVNEQTAKVEEVIEPIVQEQPPKSAPEKEQTDAYQDLYLYAISDPQIKTRLENGQELTDDQLRKISEYMVNQPYFISDFMKQLEKNPENKWISELSPSDKVEYIKIIGVLTNQEINNSTKLEEVRRQILDHPGIGPVLSNYMKLHPESNPIKSGNLVIASNYL